MIHTTDGELMVLCKDTWRIREGTRDAVLARLGELGFDMESDKAITSFRWIRENASTDPLPTVHLGTVTVTGDEVAVETRSRERHAELKKRVVETLDSLVEHVNSEERDQAELFEEMNLAGGKVQEDLEPIPAHVQQQVMREFVARHDATWPDIAVPALGDKTPREAVKTAKGRSAVEALLRDMEFRTHGSPMEGVYDFDELRKALGL